MNNQYEQFGYDHFEEIKPQQPRKSGGFGKILKSPLTAILVLGTTGAVFTGVLIGSFMQNSTSEEAIPVIQAQSKPFKVVPDDVVATQLAYEDSTVFSAIDTSAGEDERPIENLLASAGPEELKVKKSTVKSEDYERMAPLIETETASVLAAPSVEARVVHDIKAAGTSPETIEFVRSVLDQKGQSPSESASGIEPAAGAAIGAAPKRMYFVQLGSVQSAAGASAEWTKYQKIFSTELTGLGHRIQEANLGPRGMYYRIQAGPLTKAQAGAICDSIKMQKPSGCLVTR